MSERVRCADPIEAETFLYKHADIEAVDLLVADSNGVLRGKRVGAKTLSKVYEQGMALPASIFASLITGDTASHTELGFSSGDADRLCFPVPGSLHVSPWQPRPLAQALLAMYELDGSAHFADPRHVVDSIVERFDALSLETTVAFELEFYLLDRERDGRGAPQPPLAANRARRESQTQVYGIRELDLFDALLDDIVKAAEIQQLPVENVVSEYAPGQYEVNLGYQTDPILACDHAILLKRLVIALARKHGFTATFMAKPYEDWSGNGMHLHVGVRTREGENYFVSDADRDDPTANPRLREAIAGLSATMAESVAICAPNANAYRRLCPGAFAPLSPHWGVNNRTVALRIPIGPLDARRIEHRIAGADANPYLVMATVLAGVHHGLTEQLVASEPVVGNAYDLEDRSLPRTWTDALAAFDASTVLSRYFGPRFCTVFSRTQHAERELFDRHVTPLEWLWYL